MQTKRNFFTIFVIALASAALVFTASTPSDAGWYKKAKKAAKKAQHSVEKAAKNINAEANRFQASVHAESQRLNTNLAREGGRFVGDVSRESKRLGGDISREGKKFAGDVSREGKRFGGDVSRQLTNPGGYMTPYDWAGGLSRLGKNIEGAGQQLGHNLTQGERTLTHNIDRGVTQYGINLSGGQDFTGSFGWKLFDVSVGTLLSAGPVSIFNETAWKNLNSGVHRLGDNIGKGGTRVGDAVGDELGRGYHSANDAIFGPPKVTDLDKSDKDQELPTGKVANALTEKKDKVTDVVQPSEPPVAIFRAETNKGMGESVGSSTTIFKEHTGTTGLGSSTGSSSGLGGSQTIGKKESTSSPLSSPGTSGRSSPRRK